MREKLEPVFGTCTQKTSRSRADFALSAEDQFLRECAAALARGVSSGISASASR